MLKMSRASDASHLHGVRERRDLHGRGRVVFPITIVILASCGGKVAPDEHIAETSLDGSSADGTIAVPDAGPIDVDNEASDANASMADGTDSEPSTVAKDESGSAAETGSPTDVRCPSTCTGGCDGGTCSVACNVTSACESSSVVCPTAMPCHVDCSGTSACATISIVCPSDAPCNVVCNGLSACQDTKVSCPDSAPCNVQCGGADSCQGGVMSCGAGPCLASCTASDTQMAVSGCDRSSNCHGGCSCPPLLPSMKCPAGP